MKNRILTAVLATLLLAAPRVFAQSAIDIRINELQVENLSGLTDEQGNRCGWIELFNTAFGMVDVGGFYISDDMNYRTKYMIPKGNVRTQMPLRRYLLLYADGNPQAGVFHMNFTLDGVDTLYMFAPDSTLIDKIAIPEIPADKSYGRYYDGEGSHQPYGAIQKSARKNVIDRKVLENDEVLGTVGGWAVLGYPTPGSTNSTEVVETKSQKMAKMDPYGLILSVTAIAVVFTGLIILFICFRAIGKKAMKGTGDKKKVAEKKAESAAPAVTVTAKGADDEIAAAIAVALHYYAQESGADSGIHDIESDVITIDKKYSSNSPWGSKYLTLKRDPIVK